MGMNDVFQELSSKEKCKGIFLANCMPSIWWYFLIGPLASFKMKQYIISLYDDAIHFTRLDLWGKAANTDEFSYDEIKTLELKNGMITKKWNISINDNRLKLIVPFRKSENEKLLDPSKLEFLKSKANICN